MKRLLFFVITVLIFLPKISVFATSIVDDEIDALHLQQDVVEYGNTVTSRDPVFYSTVLLVGTKVKVKKKVKVVESRLCTGTVISKKLVLTAAHCMPDELGEDLFVFPPNRASLLVKLYKDYPEKFGDVDVVTYMGLAANNFGIRVLAARSHEEYNPRNIRKGFDIAILKTEAKIPNVQIARLPKVNYELQTNQMITVSGFGRDENNSFGELKKITIDKNYKIISSKKTPQLREKGSGDIIIVSGKKNTCDGDSGGPIYVNDEGELVVIGVVATGSDSACDTSYYGRVLKFLGFFSHKDKLSTQTYVPSFVDWIKEKAKELGKVQGI